MKTTKIKFNEIYPHGYMYTGDFAMSWMKKPPAKYRDKFDFEPCHAYSWHACRETFVSAYINSLNEHDHTYKSIPKDRMRIMIMRAGQGRRTESKANGFYEWMENGARILNMLENEVGWGLTSVKKAVSPNIAKKDKYGVVFVASPRWMKSTQLMSLFLLVIRSAKRKHVKALKDLDDIPKMLEKVKTDASGDMGFVKRSAHMWSKVMKYSDEIFKKELGCLQNGQYGINGLLSKTNHSCTAATKNRWLEVNKKYE